MSGTKPTLDEYFARARRDGIPATESTLDLLSEYKTKAERQRRRRRAAVVTAFSFLFLGAIGFEFSMHYSSAPGNSLADAHSHSSDSMATVHREPYISGRNQLHNSQSDRIASNQAVLPGRSAQAATRSARPDSRKNQTTDSRKVQPSPHLAAVEVPATEEVAADRSSGIIEVSNSAFLAPPAMYHRRAVEQRFIAPADNDANPFFAVASPAQREQRTLALTVGARYGTAASDISPINEQLAELDFPTLPSQYRQTTVQAGIATENLTLGVAYTSPYTETVTGIHKLSYAIANVEPPTVVTTFSHKRWSTFGEYSFAITDEFRIDAGAQVSFTSYELGLESNYAAPLALNPHQNSGGEASGDLWTGMWNNVSAPDISSNFDEKTWRPHPVGGISTNSIGISPTVGLSWRALPAISLQCRVGYMFNLKHEWRMNSTGTPVTGMKNQLRMDEYSISIGASFYQWLF